MKWIVLIGTVDISILPQLIWIYIYLYFSSDLPSVETITMNIYRESEKKKKKDKHFLIGKLNIVSYLSFIYLIETFITLVVVQILCAKNNALIN